MSTLEIGLLGPPTVTWNGKILNVCRRKVRALLFRLAVELCPVTRDHLASLFWAVVPDAISRRNLTHLLTHLKQALPEPDMLQMTPDFVFLNPDLVESDTQKLLLLFRHPGLPVVEPDFLEEAVTLYRGAFLEGFSLGNCPEFDEWLTLERNAWEQRYLYLLTNLVKSSTAHTEAPAAVDHARVDFSRVPLDADVHRRMIELFLAGGEEEMVLHQFERCADLLEKLPIAKERSSF